jgi:hypothetical protein
MVEHNNGARATYFSHRVYCGAKFREIINLLSGYLTHAGSKNDKSQAIKLSIEQRVILTFDGQVQNIILLAASGPTASRPPLMLLSQLSSNHTHTRLNTIEN